MFDGCRSTIPFFSFPKWKYSTILCTKMEPKEEKKNSILTFKTIWIVFRSDSNYMNWGGLSNKSVRKWLKSWKLSSCILIQKWVGFKQIKYIHIWEVIWRFSTQLKLKMKMYPQVLKWCSRFSHGSSHFMFTSTECRISIQTDNLLSFCWLFFWFNLASSLLEHKFSCICYFFGYFFCVSFVFKLEAINHQC